MEYGNQGAESLLECTRGMFQKSLFKLVDSLWDKISNLMLDTVDDLGPVCFRNFSVTELNQ